MDTAVRLRGSAHQSLRSHLLIPARCLENWENNVCCPPFAKTIRKTFILSKGRGQCFPINAKLDLFLTVTYTDAVFAFCRIIRLWKLLIDGAHL